MFEFDEKLIELEGKIDKIKFNVNTNVLNDDK